MTITCPKGDRTLPMAPGRRAGRRGGAGRGEGNQVQGVYVDPKARTPATTPAFRDC